LLWFQSLSTHVNFLLAVPILAIAGLLVIGLSALGWVIFRIGYVLCDELSNDTSVNLAVRIAYSGVMGAILLLIFVAAVSYIYIFASLALHGFASR